MPEMKDLPWLPWVILGVTVAVALYYRRRAPAVTIGLLGGIVGGVWGHIIADGTEVPSEVAGLALVFLFVSGLFGLGFKPLASRRFLRFSALLFLALAPVVGWMTWVVMKYSTCYAYDPPDRRWCGGIDLFEGTSGLVTAEAVLIMLFLSGLLLLSAWRVPRRPKTSEPSPRI